MKTVKNKHQYISMADGKPRPAAMLGVVQEISVAVVLSLC